MFTLPEGQHRFTEIQVLDDFGNARFAEPEGGRNDFTRNFHQTALASCDFSFWQRYRKPLLAVTQEVFEPARTSPLPPTVPLSAP